MAAAAFGVWSERTRVGQYLSGPVVTMLVTLVLSNVGIIPTTSSVYDTIWAYLVPVGIALLLFQANMLRLIRDSGKLLGVFACATIATVIGSVVAYGMLAPMQDAWKIASVYCATYIGGALNFVATAQAVELSGDTLTAAVAADNVVGIAYFLFLSILPSSRLVRRILRATEGEGRGSSSSIATSSGSLEGKPLTALGALMAIAVAATVCTVGTFLGGMMEAEQATILIITLLTVVLATIAPGPMAAVGGSLEIGMVLMQVFFAAVGASANIVAVLYVGPAVAVAAAMVLIVHFFVILLAARIFRFRLPDMVIASNAAVGGPATAAALATAMRWPKLVVPGVVCGTIGYAIGTFIGVGLGQLLR